MSFFFFSFPLRLGCPTLGAECSLTSTLQKTNLFRETISTGALTLDVALGGGLPKGRIVEIYGPESSGKTTIALHAIAEVQKNGGRAALIDAEHAFDPVYAAALGSSSRSCSSRSPSRARRPSRSSTSSSGPTRSTSSPSTPWLP